MEKVVIYSRVSTGMQSTNRQDYDLLDFCKRENYEVVKIYNDTVSGLKKNDDRPELKSMIEFVTNKSNNIDGVIVTEISRLGRKLSHVLANIDMFTDSKVFVQSTSTNIIRTLKKDKSRDEHAFLMLGIMGSIAQMERETIVQRSKSGIREKIKENLSFSGGKYTPYGYTKINKRLIINEEEAEAVRLIFNMSLSGNGCTSIAKEMNKTPHKTRRYKNGDIETFNGNARKAESFGWTNSTIWTMLTNKLYKGVREINDDLDDGTERTTIVKSPIIIDEKTFDDVQERLKSRKNKIGIKRKFDYIIKNEKFECGLCGRTYYPLNRNVIVGKIGKHDSRYMCLSRKYFTGKNKSLNCGNYGIGIDKMTSSVWYFLRRQTELERQLKKSIENSTIKNEIGLLENCISFTSKSLRKLELRKDTLIEMRLNDQIEIDDYTKNYALIISQREKLSDELQTLKNKLSNLNELQRKQSNLNEIIRTMKGSSDLMRKYVNEIVRKIVIYPVKESKLKFSNHASDKMIVIDMFLFANETPITYTINQRSNKILRLIKGEFNYKTFSLVGNTENMTKRTEQIIHEIKIGLL